MPIRILPRADRDIDDIILHFADQQAIRAGQRFLDAVNQSLNLLAHSPTLAASYESPNPLLQGVRVWNVKGFPKYVLCFRISQDKVVEVMRVLHGARNQESLISLSLME